MNWLLFAFMNIIEGIIIYHFWFTQLERRFSKKVSAVIYVTGYIFNVTRAYLMYDNVMLRAALTNIFLLILLQILFKDKWYKKVIMHAIYMMCIIPAEYLGVIFAKYVYHFDMVNLKELTLPGILWYVTTYIFIFMFSTIAILLLNHKKLDLESKVTRYVFLYAAVQCLMLFAITMFVFQYKIMSFVMMAVIFGVIIASVVLGVVLYKNVKAVATKEAEAEFIKKENEIQDKHFAELKAQYAEYRKLRHDYINHLKIIKELSEPDKVKEYTKAIEEKFEKMEKASFCNNLAVDALLSLKRSEAEQAGVDIAIEVCSIEGCSIADFDLCVVMSNLLDNAIEAARKTKDGYVKVRIAHKAERMVVTVKNSALSVDMNLKTTKENSEQHGIGIESIKEIAKKHDGEYVAAYEDNEFVGVVSMKF